MGVVSFTVPAGALDFWRDRLAQHKLRVLEVPARFGEQAIGLVDPDGLRLELIASNRAPSTGVWSDSIVPAQYAIRGIHSATLTLASAGSRRLRLAHRGAGIPARSARRTTAIRFEAGARGPGAIVDLRVEPDAPSRAERGRVRSITSHGALPARASNPACEISCCGVVFLRLR
mgnify:CR=1 FL=1